MSAFGVAFGAISGLVILEEGEEEEEEREEGHVEGANG